MEFLCTTNITTADKLSNLNFIQTMDELNRVVVDNKQHHKVIIRKDFIDEYFPYDSVSEYINSVNKLNPNIIIETQGYTIQQNVDADMLNMIASNLNRDDLHMLMQFRSHDFIETLFKLIQSYNAERKFELEGASMISSLREVIDAQNKRIEDLERSLSTEIKNKVDVQDKLSVLINRINFTHNVGVEEKMLFRSETNNYDKVIYIKEITRVQYIDTFVRSLQEILKLVYNMPARVVVIEGYYANGKVKQYPELKPHYRLTERDVLQGDILMLGYQPKLFNDIMRNPSNISIMIVLDRGGYESPHLFGDNVEYLFTASDLEDVDESIPRSRIISYKQDTLFIPYIKKFNELSTSEKVQKYSSLKIMKQLMGLIEN